MLNASSWSVACLSPTPSRAHDRVPGSRRGRGPPCSPRVTAVWPAGPAPSCSRAGSPAAQLGPPPPRPQPGRLSITGLSGLLDLSPPFSRAGTASPPDTSGAGWWEATPRADAALSAPRASPCSSANVSGQGSRDDSDLWVHSRQGPPHPDPRKCKAKAQGSSTYGACLPPRAGLGHGELGARGRPRAGTAGVGLRPRGPQAVGHTQSCRYGPGTQRGCRGDGEREGLSLPFRGPITPGWAGQEPPRRDPGSRDVGSGQAVPGRESRSQELAGEEPVSVSMSSSLLSHMHALTHPTGLFWRLLCQGCSHTPSERSFILCLRFPLPGGPSVLQSLGVCWGPNT